MGLFPSEELLSETLLKNSQKRTRSKKKTVSETRIEMHRLIFEQLSDGR